LSLSAFPDFINDDVETPTTYASAAVVATPTGGRAPYIYVWTRLSGDTGFVINTPSSAVTRFSRSVVADDTYSAEFQCAVTDADGNTATTTVNITVNGFSPF
jgi:hypothetical protein